MINNKEFSILMATYIVPETLQIYIKNNNCDYMTAVHNLYQSDLFKRLENKKTRLWHLSPMQLAEILKDEIDQGYLEIPYGAPL